jgi:hypothetical protein
MDEFLLLGFAGHAGKKGLSGKAAARSQISANRTDQLQKTVIIQFALAAFRTGLPEAGSAARL